MYTSKKAVQKAADGAIESGNLNPVVYIQALVGGFLVVQLKLTPSECFGTSTIIEFGVTQLHTPGLYKDEKKRGGGGGGTRIFHVHKGLLEKNGKTQLRQDPCMLGEH